MHAIDVQRELCHDVLPIQFDDTRNRRMQEPPAIAEFGTQVLDGNYAMS